LELTEFNVLIGRNNVGKTAILEALYLLRMPFATYPLPPYGEDLPTLLSKLHGGPSSLIYGYAGEARIIYRLTHKVEFKAGESLWDVDSVEIALDSGGSIRSKLDGRVISDDLYRAFIEGLSCGLDRNPIAFYIPNHTGYYEKLEGFALSEQRLRWIEKSGLHRRVAGDIISKVVYDRFTEVLVRRDRLCLRKEVEGATGPLYVDISSVGEGVRRFVLAYLATEYLDPRILLWDDVEVAAHPSLVEALLSWLASSGRQVVIATHSIDLLHALTMVKPRNSKVIVLRKAQDDIVEWRAIELDELEDMLESGIDVRKIVDELEMQVKA